jgi:hypothetical protein
MSQQKEQSNQGGIPINSSSDAFWFFMDSHQSKRKQLTGPKKTISKPEIDEKRFKNRHCCICKKIYKADTYSDSVDHDCCSMNCHARR